MGQKFTHPIKVVVFYFNITTTKLLLCSRVNNTEDPTYCLASKNKIAFFKTITIAILIGIVIKLFPEISNKIFT